jgi:hypothetical protein
VKPRPAHISPPPRDCRSPARHRRRCRMGRAGAISTGAFITAASTDCGSLPTPLGLSSDSSIGTGPALPDRARRTPAPPRDAELITFELATPPRRRVSYSRDPLLGWTGISTPSTASLLRAASAHSAAGSVCEFLASAWAGTCSNSADRRRPDRLGRQGKGTATAARMARGGRAPRRQLDRPRSGGGEGECDRQRQARFPRNAGTRPVSHRCPSRCECRSRRHRLRSVPAGTAECLDLADGQAQRTSKRLVVDPSMSLPRRPPRVPRERRAAAPGRANGSSAAANC